MQQSIGAHPFRLRCNLPLVVLERPLRVLLSGVGSVSLGAERAHTSDERRGKQTESDELQNVVTERQPFRGHGRKRRV
jgi:hypothetical protein